MTVANDQASVWLEQIWAAVEGDPGLTERVRMIGPPGLLPSVYDVGALATASVAAATLAVAELGARRGRNAGAGSGVPEVEIDRFAAAAVFRSEALLRPLGWALPAVWDSIAGDYRAADGWIRLHTNYPYHRSAALRALGLDPRAEVDREQVGEQVGRRAVADLERTVVAAGGCAAVLHTADEWAAHPHGAVARVEPAVRLERRPGAAERKASEAGARPGPGLDAGPLAGLRVLDLTRVLAGPICTRTLAAWGADVLRVDPVGFAEVPALLPDTTVGKNCTAMDLRLQKDRDRFAELVAEADVIVHGLRPGALAGLGFGDHELRRLNPELQIASVNAYGWAGPWADRRGFDSLVQFSCGIAAAGGAAAGSDRPVPLPAQALDHAAGYLLAAAVCRGLTGRYDGLAPAELRACLVGVANLLMQQVVSSVSPVCEVDLGTATVSRETEWGPVRAVAQPGTIAGVAGSWRVRAGSLGRHSPIFPG
jgi:CoA transferase family III